MKRSTMLLAALCALAGVQVAADVRLPGILSDNMVLQRDTPLKIWGWADDGEEVTVTLNGQTAKATAVKGRWEVGLNPMPAGGPYELTVSGKNQLKLGNVMLGEVWICSGQSNMEWRLNGVENARAEIDQANLPNVRLFNGNTYRASGSPQADIPGRKWVVCTPQTAAGFSAVGYFFGKFVNEETKLPVGLISVNWGGTRIEPWTSYYGFTTQKTLEGIANQLRDIQPGTDTYKKDTAEGIAAIEAWVAQAKLAQANEWPIPDVPDLPGALRNRGHGAPSTLYNNMIAPLTNYAVRGALWYQGEANVGEGMLYRDKMNALVASWRKEFNNPKMPFYFVQLAPYNYGDPNRLVSLWEAQQAFADGDEYAGMAVINDIGNFRDIHPRNKRDVGYRLALLALKRDYGKTDLVADSPAYQSHEVKGNQLIVTMRNATKLSTSDGQPARYFELAGADCKFYPATAELNGNQITLTSPQVPEPLLMRFAWTPDITVNLVNENKLPAGSFRAGELPPVSTLMKGLVPETADLQIAYRFNPFDALNGSSANYLEDNSAKLTGELTKVGYFVYLTEPSGKMSYAFVTMDPFATIDKIGLPVAAWGEQFLKIVKNLTVKSNVDGVKNGTFEDGNIEFFFSNYGAPNSANIPGASSNSFDFGDTPNSRSQGYGSFQVHNYREKQTVFAFNNFSTRNNCDLGIGNCPNENSDWTFSRAGSKYNRAEIIVLVQTK